MATHTLSTSSALTAVTFSPSSQVLLPADLAAIANGIKNDQNPALPAVPASFTYNGLLFVPGGRGVLKVYPGDVVAIDNQGAVILVPKNSIANGNWTFT